MDSRIKELVEKYWECETSLEEEKELKDYFKMHSVSDEWKETATLFKYFETQHRQHKVKAEFDNKVKEKINNSNKGNVVKMFFMTAKIAAGVLVLVAATYLVREEVRKSYPTEMVDTYSDPELAFEETKKALMMISKTFGKAQQETRKISVFNEAEQIIQKGAKDDSSEKVDI